MLTYSFDAIGNKKIYIYLYECIKNDITNNKLKSGDKLPSKRAFAANLGISIVTVESAYVQLQSEGYIYSIEKKGFFVSEIKSDIKVQNDAKKHEFRSLVKMESEEYKFDFTNNSLDFKMFPFSIWNKLLREVITYRKNELMEKQPSGGCYELRESIAVYLQQFKNMNVNPEQIIIGSGNEHLYNLLIQLFGKDKIYAIENPGYKKIAQIYECNEVLCQKIQLDENGIKIEELERQNPQIVHISPSHHFPTGIITPISRRYELLGWAAAGPRYIIEDDYDTEFRLVGRPIPSLFSIDMSNKVIYMNTFSKSLASTIRISYMVLPKPLMEEFNNKLNYLSCTVSTFEQYTLAEFINQGYFERHINRMRNNYKKLRQQLLKALTSHPDHERIKILQQSSGLYFLLQIDTSLSDRDLQARLRQKGLMLQPLQHYYQN